MYINEMTEDTFTLMVECKGRVFEFKTTRIEMPKKMLKMSNKSHFVVLNQVRINGTPLSIEKENVQVVGVADGNAYGFTEVTVEKCKISSEIYLVVSSNQNVKKINRRKFVRFYIGASCTVLIPENKKAQQCVVKDISQSGIAFVLPFSEDIKRGDILHYTFIDEIKTDKGVEKMELAGVARVCRLEMLEKGKVLVGCTINCNSQTRQYIAKKEQEILQKRRDNKAYEKRER